MMIEPGWKVYRGMIVGEHTATTTWSSTCSRQAAHQHSDDVERRSRPADAPIRMTLEKSARLYQDDELVEVTPASIRCARSCSTRPTRKREDRARTAAAEAVVILRVSSR